MVPLQIIFTTVMKARGEVHISTIHDVEHHAYETMLFVGDFGDGSLLYRGSSKADACTTHALHVVKESVK